jgi:hypothetical protein
MHARKLLSILEQWPDLVLFNLTLLNTYIHRRKVKRQSDATTVAEIDAQHARARFLKQNPVPEVVFTQIQNTILCRTESCDSIRPN